MLNEFATYQSDCNFPIKGTKTYEMEFPLELKEAAQNACLALLENGYACQCEQLPGGYFVEAFEDIEIGEDAYVDELLDGDYGCEV